MLNNLHIMFYRLSTDFGINMVQRSKLIAVLLSGLILECVGINSIKPQSIRSRKRLYLFRILGNIPGDMQGNRSAGLIQGMQQSDILNLLFQRTWFTFSRKSTKTRSSGTQGPAWDSNLKFLQFIQYLFHIFNSFRYIIE